MQNFNVAFLWTENDFPKVRSPVPSNYIQLFTADNKHSLSVLAFQRVCNEEAF